MRRSKPALPTLPASSAGCAQSERPIEAFRRGDRPEPLRVPGERTQRRGRLLSVPEAADQLGVSEKTIRRTIQRGDLVAHRIGRLLRIAEGDLAAFVARHRVWP